MKIKFFIKMQLLMFLCSFFASTKSIDPRKELFIGTPWEFMEEELIIKAKEFLEKSTTTLCKVSSSVLIGLMTGIIIELCLAKIFAQENEYLRKESNSPWHRDEWHIKETNGTINNTIKQDLINALDISTETVVKISAMVLAALFSYKIIGHQLKKYTDYAIFEQFIKEWPDNKYLTPKRFHRAYDALFDLYSKELTFEKFKKIVPEVLSKTRLLIFQQFPEKYQNRLKPREGVIHSFDHVLIFDFKPIMGWFSKLFAR